MEICFSKELNDLDGKIIKALNGENATVRGTVIEALLATFQDEQGLSGEEKLKRWELALKVKNATDPAEVTVEEIALMKKLVGKAYGPLVVGQVWKVLEGK